MGKRKKSQCENGELMIYCHYDEEMVRCADCWPCADCEPCAYCELDPCPYSKPIGGLVEE